MLKLVQLTKENIQQFTSKPACVLEPNSNLEYFNEFASEFGFNIDVVLCIKKVT